MYNPADIAFVDSHTESNRCADNVYPVVDKIILCLFAHRGRKSGMIGGCLDPVGRKLFSQFFRTVPAHAVDDTALLSVCMDEMDDGGRFLFLV